jgi:hypothetical protein
MTTEPVLTRRESVFTAVLLFPLRALERAHGWRRLALLIVYGLIALPILAVLWRRSQLAGLPDLGEAQLLPAAGARAKVQLPDDQNAFAAYWQAAQRFREMTDSEQKSFSNANLSWSAADQVLRGWIAAHREAIALLRAGSERPEASLDLPGRATDWTTAVNDQEIVRRLFFIGDAALFEAGRLQSEGDPIAAWALLKAVVRASRDMERAAPTTWCRTTAMMLLQYAREPVAAWARDPKVKVDLLRQALADLAASEALTPPISNYYRSEYRTALDSLANLQPSIAERARGRAAAAAGAFDLAVHAPNLDAFLRGEPERSRRVLLLLAANDLAWCDRPAHERPPFAVPRLQIYENDGSSPPAAQPLPPEELARWSDSVLLNPALPWRTGELEKLEKIDRWSLGRLKEAVAVPLFTRETGRKPASPAEALRRYLPMPGDDADRDEAEPVSPRSGR